MRSNPMFGVSLSFFPPSSPHGVQSPANGKVGRDGDTEVDGAEDRGRLAQGECTGQETGEAERGE